MKWLLSFRGRALTFALALFGLALAGPRIPRGFWHFVLSPLGPGVAALVLIVLGDFVEEMGRMSRIRLGVAIRLSSIVALASSAVWIGMVAPSSDLLTYGFVMFAIAAIPILVVARHDLAVFADPRHGQDLRFVEFDRRALHVRSNERMVSIPISRVLAAHVEPLFAGRAVVLTIDRSNAAPLDLPWKASAVLGDVLFLDEHQLGMDAEQFVDRLRTIAGDEDAYR